MQSQRPSSNGAGVLPPFFMKSVHLSDTQKQLHDKVEQYRAALEALNKEHGLTIVATVEYHPNKGIHPVIKIVEQPKE